MIIDNFEQIKSLLSFESNDWFYHLQILKRKKDCEEHDKGRNNNARCIKTYYINSVEYLELRKEEIIKLCEMFNARAYINLNAKSLEKAAFELNYHLADRLKFKQFEHLSRAYNTVIGGKEVNVGKKKWIIDIDTKDWQIIIDTIHEINKCQSNIYDFKLNFGNNIIDVIPTINGWHIITIPFNLKQIEPFMSLNPFDIQKNNPTILYFNKIENEEENKK